MDESKKTILFFNVINWKLSLYSTTTLIEHTDTLTKKAMICPIYVLYRYSKAYSDVAGKFRIKINTQQPFVS